MVFKAAHKIRDTPLIFEPVFFIVLNLKLCITQLFIKISKVFFLLFLQVEKILIFCNFIKTTSDQIAKSISLLNQHFLNRKQVPVLPNGLQKIVEEVVELLS